MHKTLEILLREAAQFFYIQEFRLRFADKDRVLFTPISLAHTHTHTLPLKANEKFSEMSEKT